MKSFQEEQYNIYIHMRGVLTKVNQRNVSCMLLYFICLIIQIIIIILTVNIKKNVIEASCLGNLSHITIWYVSCSSNMLHITYTILYIY